MNFIFEVIILIIVSFFISIFEFFLDAYEDQSQQSSNSGTNESSFQRQDSNIPEQVENSGSDESSEMKNQDHQESVKSEEHSDQNKQNDEESQEDSSSQSNQEKSESSPVPQPQKKNKSMGIQQSSHQNQIKVSNVSYVSQHQLQDQQIPQQQLETDDIDSNDSKNIQIQQVRGQSVKQQSLNKSQEQIQPFNQQVQKIIEQKEEKQQQKNKIKIPLKEESKQIQQQVSSQKLKQKPTQEIQVEQTKEKKKKKHKKDKKSKTKLQNLPEHDNIEQRLQKMDIEQQGAQQVAAINEQDTSNNFQQPIPEEEEQEESTNPFYEYIHPYLMLVGSNVIESYMGKKPSYKASQASQWASELSSKVLLKAYFDGLDQPEDIDEIKDKSVKTSIIQSKIQENKSYRKLQLQLNQLAQSQSFSQIPLSKIYFLIKKFKIIASCIILEKKTRAQVALNISTSCYWNKDKDGQINFSYEGKNCFVMLTLYGVENTRAQNEQENRRG